MPSSGTCQSSVISSKAPTTSSSTTNAYASNTITFHPLNPTADPSTLSSPSFALINLFSTTFSPTFLNTLEVHNLPNSNIPFFSALQSFITTLLIIPPEANNIRPPTTPHTSIKYFKCLLTSSPSNHTSVLSLFQLETQNCPECTKYLVPNLTQQNLHQRAFPPSHAQPI
ncbi:hypothetical protein MAM1_0461d10614 [Mucor ambiguus]|uniref:Uncharacterized protein n=1 Tax=Mucor ambiguus TaxID=91626 RepID=A0A0C9LYG6_9FUNG|nr:hypothetical protein MAM1_0461d10614 [Mucor ambiguus]